MFKFFKSKLKKLSSRLSSIGFSIGNKIKNIFSKNKTDDALEELEKLLYESDLGVKAALELTEKVKEYIKENKNISSEDIINKLKEEICLILNDQNTKEEEFKTTPHVIMVVGTNGSGKTTSIAKLAKHYQDLGKSVLIIAADTYRVAAVEQLNLWANKLNINIVKSQKGSDPSAVVYDGISSAIAKNIDVVLIDTAGRLHTKTDLMQELEKIKALKRENARIKKQYSEMKRDKDDITQIAKDSTKANKYALSTYNYLAKAFTDAPPIKRLGNHEIEKIMYEKDNEVNNLFQLVEMMGYHHEYGRLHQYIGDAIIALYKKKDPNTQSIWNSDTQRLSYVIRMVVGDEPDKKIQWMRDSGGSSINDLIVKPILEYVDNVAHEYISTIPEDDFGIIVYNKKLVSAHKVSKEIRDDKTIGKSILTYIAPHFHFKSSSMIELKS